jgi:predicted transposase/invertase (TIGR01784 family)
LPGAITRDLDFNTLQLDKESFTDKRLRRHYSDILYHIRYRENPAFIYFLFDHKSKEKKKKRKLAPLQLLRYMTNIWDRHIKRHKTEDKLPPIIPIIIYHGEAEWKVSTDFLSLFEVPGSMEKYIPRFSFELYDISHMPDEYIKGNIQLRILFLTLKYIFSPGLLHKLPKIFGLVSELKDKSSGAEYLEVLMRYFTNSAAYVSVEDIQDAADEIIEKGGDIMPTIVQQIKREIANQFKGELTEARNDAAKARKEKEEIAWNAMKEKEETARKLLHKGMDLDSIVEITGISRERLNQMFH